ncbi:Scr1 family TA system antitoxin-like transcriptional regulator [Streptomyces sp. NPDC060053]|uniref:Scr1 family TA system antitoxin-like transcriptional regulator n=1 Tax=Streptomyces sp. NPDC060053 TaxID=3347047 RepID=UPI003682EAC2
MSTTVIASAESRARGVVEVYSMDGGRQPGISRPAAGSRAITASASLTVSRSPSVRSPNAFLVPAGGTAVAKRQLEHLLAQSERDSITIRVIPFAIGAYPGSGQTFVHLHGPVPRLDTVSLDQSHGPALVDAEAELDTYRNLLQRMESVALPPEKTRDFIHNMTTEL